MTTGQWHVFFDTTELVSKRLLNPTLPGLLDQRRSRAYISRLCVEERVWQRVRQVQGAYDRAKDAAKDVAAYTEITLGTLDQGETLVGRIRSDTHATLPSWLTVVPTDAVPLATLLDWSSRRSPPFRGDSNPTGFHDAVILLSYLQYAKTQGLTPCLFVTFNHKDFPAEHIRAIGAGYGAEWEVLAGVDELLTFLADPDLASELTRAFSDKSLIEAAIRSMVLRDAVDEIQEDLRLKEPIAVQLLSVEDVHVYLADPAMVEDEANVEFTLTAELLLRAKQKWRYHPRSSTPKQGGLFPTSLLISGRGAVTIGRRKIVGKPRILSMSLDGISVPEDSW